MAPVLTEKLDDVGLAWLAAMAAFLFRASG